MTTTTSFIVTGMTCRHCVSAVTDESSSIPGVETVDEAGYQVAWP